MSLEVARQLLVRHSTRRGGTAPALLRDVDLREAREASVMVAALASVVETRHVRTTVVAAHRAQAAPGPPLADVWAVPVDLGNAFADAAIELALPGASTPEVCEYCKGEKTTTCYACGGDGSVRANAASSRASLCYDCWGKGKLRCATCEGTGTTVRLSMLEAIQRLDTRRHVEATVHLPLEPLERAAPASEMVLEGCPVELQRLRASGYRDASWTPRAQTAAALERLLDEARPTPGSALVRQRLTLREWNLLEVDYRWRASPGRLWIVGPAADTVIAPDAPFALSGIGRAVAAARSRIRGVFKRS